MCCEQLVCASCAHPVPDAHCPVCRAARDHLHPRAALPVQWLVWLVVLLALAAAVSAHLAH
jgi:hypothetical protein